MQGGARCTCGQSSGIAACISHGRAGECRWDTGCIHWTGIWPHGVWSSIAYPEWVAIATWSPLLWVPLSSSFHPKAHGAGVHARHVGGEQACGCSGVVVGVMRCPWQPECIMCASEPGCERRGLEGSTRPKEVSPDMKCRADGWGLRHGYRDARVASI